LFPDEVGITVPYWHEDDAAREVFKQIWEYLKIIQEITRYVIFDPHLGKLIDLQTDFDGVLSVYLGTVDHIDNVYYDENTG
jgi:hypothetical protein